jgi:hypothetical protein
MKTPKITYTDEIIALRRKARLLALEEQDRLFHGMMLPEICLRLRMAVDGAADPWERATILSTLAMLQARLDTWEPSVLQNNERLDYAVKDMVAATISEVNASKDHWDNAPYATMDTVENRLWRTLVRIVDIKVGAIYVVVPGWHKSQKIRLPLSELPENIRNAAVIGKRFHAYVNIGAVLLDDLRFEQWELA